MLFTCYLEVESCHRFCRHWRFTAVKRHFSANPYPNYSFDDQGNESGKWDGPRG